MEFKMDYHRQLEIFNPDNITQGVTVIGCGGIGSPTLMAISKMGIKNITAYDFDTVEAHNRSSQMFRRQDIGTNKTDAIKGIVEDFADVTIDVKCEPVTKDTKLSGLVISGVDSMEARMEIWNAVKFNPNISLYIDGRMGGELARILSVIPHNPSQISFYESTLHSDEDSQELPCTGRAIIYNTFNIASYVAKLTAMHFKGEEVPKEIISDLSTLTFIVPVNREYKKTA